MNKVLSIAVILLLMVVSHGHAVARNLGTDLSRALLMLPQAQIVVQTLPDGRVVGGQLRRGPIYRNQPRPRYPGIATGRPGWVVYPPNIPAARAPSPQLNHPANRPPGQLGVVGGGQCVAIARQIASAHRAQILRVVPLQGACQITLRVPGAYGQPPRVETIVVSG